MALSEIKIEDEVFTAEGSRGVGAVRAVRPDTLLVHFEGYGDVELGPEAIRSAHDGKVILEVDHLPSAVQARLPHIHDGETRA